MDPSTRNLLYERAELYELVYPEPDEATPRMCLRMFERFLGKIPGSLLDVACGTGRDLNVLSRTIPDCRGFDLLLQAIAYARLRRPHLQLDVGDMRTLRLGRKFEAITCFGSALTYALTNEDIDATLRTMAIHAERGGLLLLDLTNGASFLAGGSLQSTRTFQVDAPGFKAQAEVWNTFDRRAQQLIRRRVWQIEGQTDPIEDFCRYRLFFPEELRHRLAEHGFAVLGLFDNMELQESDLPCGTLYVAARFGN